MSHPKITYTSISSIDKTSSLHPNHCFDYSNFLTNKDSILNGFSIMHLNIQSLRAKHTALECFLAEVNDFDVLCFSETWLNDFNFQCYNFTNYNHLSSVRQKRCGGTSIFIKNHHHYTLRDDIKTKLWEDSTFEIVIAELRKLPTNFLIACVYRSPNSNINKFLRLLESLFDIAINENKLLLIGGDFNIDILQTSSNTHDLMSALLTSNFNSLIHLPTRVTDHSSTCLDNFITNIPNINSTGVLQTDISDHYPIFVDLAIYTPERNYRPQLKAYRRHITTHSKQLFVNIISKHDWSPIIEESDVDKKYNIFINSFTQYMNLCFPLRLYNIDSDKKNPWFNSQVKQLNRIKSSLYLLSLYNPRLKLPYNRLNKHYKKLLN